MRPRSSTRTKNTLLPIKPLTIKPLNHAEMPAEKFRTDRDVISLSAQNRSAGILCLSSLASRRKPFRKCFPGKIFLRARTGSCVSTRIFFPRKRFLPLLHASHDSSGPESCFSPPPAAPSGKPGSASWPASGSASPWTPDRVRRLQGLPHKGP